MPDCTDRRLYLFAPLTAPVNRFINLSEDLAPAWKTQRLVAMPRRHVTILDLSVADMPLAQSIRAARRIVADGLPQAFRMNIDELVVTRERALLMPSEPVRGALRCQSDLLHAATRRGFALPGARVAPRPHVTLGYDYADDIAPTRIDGISWQVEELRLVLSHHGDTLHEELDRWHLPERRALAA